MAVSARRRLLALSIKMTAGLRGRKWKRKPLDYAAGISENGCRSSDPKGSLDENSDIAMS
jgi:hypothetical protein